MAMTLRLTAAETEALRRRAQKERTSMQELARRALGEYLQANGGIQALEVTIAQELGRYAVAMEQLARWRD